MEDNTIIKIDSIGTNGVGVGKLEDGKTCFVPFTLASEVCQIEILENHSDYAFAKATQILEKSKDRIIPSCEIFEKCGGCNFLHTTYENEIKIKKDIVLQNISRIGKTSYNKEIEIIKTNERFYYRNNVQIKTTSNGEIGFYAPKTLKIIPFPNFKCLLLTKNMQDFIDSLDKKFFLFTKGFTLRDGLKIYSAHLNYPTDGNFCEYKVNEFIYRVGISDFFQVNTFLLDKFQNRVASLIEENLSTVELYGGAGFFSLPISKKLQILKVNEISKRAIANGIFNAKQNNIKNIEFIASDASIFIKKFNDIEQILVDPPRAGMEKEVIDTIINSKINRIIYVSCNPSTFSRDLSLLSIAGFKLEDLYIIDNFPSTYHIEIIGKITR